MAEHRYLRRIAAELRDIRLHPFESGNLIQQPVVAGSVPAFATELRCCEEPERTHAIGDADEHHALLREVRAVIEGRAGYAAVEAAAVDPRDDRQLVARRFGGSPDIEIQAVLAHRDARSLTAQGRG